VLKVFEAEDMWLLTLGFELNFDVILLLSGIVLNLFGDELNDRVIWLAVWERLGMEFWGVWFLIIMASLKDLNLNLCFTFAKFFDISILFWEIWPVSSREGVIFDFKLEFSRLEFWPVEFDDTEEVGKRKLGLLVMLLCELVLLLWGEIEVFVGSLLLELWKLAW